MSRLHVIIMSLSAFSMLGLICCQSVFSEEPESQARSEGLPYTAEDHDPSHVHDRTGAWTAPSEEQYKAALSPLEYKVLRRKGTERAFTGRYWDEKADGTYHCRACGQPLFDSRTKFKSGTGWPSFFTSIEGTVAREMDLSHGMARTELICSRCKSHLGHIFNDGPAPTGQRYCINSASLELLARPQEELSEAKDK